MATSVKAIPDGYHSITPYLTIKGAAQAIEFYKKALGAVELFRMAAPSGEIGHAELKIGNSIFMLADEHPKMGNKSPKSLGGSSINLMIYTENVDGAADRAITAGMKTIREVQTQFYGDRSGLFEDPFGYTWTLSQHVEDVSPEELQKRAAKLFGGGAGC